jgi:hypothetical protein
MRHLLLVLLLAAALLPACKRHRATPTSSNSAPPSTPVASADQRGGASNPNSPALVPGPGGSQQPPASSPGAPSWHGGDRPPTGPARGKATITVAGGPLDDFILYGLSLDNGAFRLDGQGFALVGRMSKDWAGQVGKPAAVLPEVPGVGKSEFDQPGLGPAKIVGGQIVFDQVVSRDPPRVKGRFVMEIQGPDGKVPFSGTFEVGIIIK